MPLGLKGQTIVAFARVKQSPLFKWEHGKANFALPLNIFTSPRFQSKKLRMQPIDQGRKEPELVSDAEIPQPTTI